MTRHVISVAKQVVAAAGIRLVKIAAKCGRVVWRSRWQAMLPMRIVLSVAISMRPVTAQPQALPADVGAQVWLHPTASEQALIERMRALVSDGERRYLDSAISNRKVFRFGTPSDGTLAKMFDSLYAMRMARIGEMSRGTASPDSLATAILLDSLADPGVLARIERRTDQSPNDVMVFSRRHYSPEVFGTAIAELRRMRREDGVVPPHPSTRTIREPDLRAPAPTAVSKSEQFAYSALMQSSVGEVAGVGRGPILLISVMGRQR